MNYCAKCRRVVHGRGFVFCDGDEGLYCELCAREIMADAAPTSELMDAYRLVTGIDVRIEGQEV